MKRIIGFLLLVFFVSCEDTIVEIEDKTACTINYGGTFGEMRPLYKIDNLDPRTFKTGDISNTFGAIYERLTRIDQETLETVPSIAKSWTNNEDCSIFTFTIRNDVYFYSQDSSINKKVTAKTIVDCFNHISDTFAGNNTYPKAKGLIKGIKESYNAKKAGNKQNVSGIRLINDSMVQIELTHSDCNFPTTLSSVSFSIYPTEILNKHHQFEDDVAVSTGPFYYAGKDTLAYCFVKNPIYYRKDENGCLLPYLDTLKQYYYIDYRSFTKRKNMFLSGRTDVIVNISTNNIDSLINIKGFDQEAYHSIELAETAIISLNTSKPPFNNINLRKALAHALNKDKIVDSVFQGEDYPATEGLYPNFDSYNESIKGLQFNLKKAKEYLTKYKQEENINVVEINFLKVKGLASPQKELKYFFEKDLGIKVNLVDAEDIPTYFDNIFKGKYEMVIVNSSPGDATLASRIENFYGGDYEIDDKVVMDNIARYKNTEVDNLFDAALKELDEDKRNKLYFKAERKIIHDAITIPLFYSEKSLYLRPNIKGYGLNILKINDYALIHKTN